MKKFYQQSADQLSLRFSSLLSLKRTCSLLTTLCLLISMSSVAQTTYDFSTAATLSNQGGVYTTQALVSIDGVSYKLTHLGNGNFSNLSSGGNSNSACLKKDGSGGDFLKIERADGAAFQFYGMWLNTSSMYSPPFYQPPYYNIKYYDQNNAEIVAETFSSNVQNETITVTKNLKVNYVYVTLNAILYFKLDDLVVGPAAASLSTVFTAGINQFTTTSALLGGNVSADGGAAVTERGIVYNVTGTPTTADSKIVIGSGTGTYSQTVNDFSSSSMYYVRAYATNSAGTAYGSQLSFITAADFDLAQVHYFNTAWASTINQASPFTKYVEGWNITATSTGTGLVSVNRITGVTGVSAAGEGAASARAASSTSTEELVSMRVKASDASVFDLQSFKFKYLTKTANTSFGTITVTGYLNGVAVPGAVASLNGISQATAIAYAYSTFDLTGNSQFNAIDEFVITASGPVNAARLSAIDIDMLDVQSFTVLPLTLTGFTGRLVNEQAVLNWNTRQEMDMGSFDIEYSTDGIQYKRIGNVRAAGNGQLNNSYTFIHASLAAGHNYYRLKMINSNGKFTYSAVVNINRTAGKNGFAVYPNPVNGDHCFIALAAETLLPLSYRIADVDGKTVLTGRLSSNQQRINLGKLSRGSYVILLSNGQSQQLIF